MSELESKSSALPILFFVVMIDMIGFGIIIPFLTYFIEDLASAEGVLEIGLWVGLMMMSYSMAQFLFSPFWGSLSDRIGRRPVILAGLVGNTVFFTVFGLSNSLFMALVARFLAGAFNANIAVAKAYIGDVSDHTNLAKRMGLIGASFGIGFTFGPFIGGEFSNPADKWDLFVGTIFETYPYLLPCVIASVLSSLSFIFAIKWLPESRLESSSKDSTSLNPIKQIRFMFRDLRDVARMPTLGTLIAITLSVPVGLFSARNIAPNFPIYLICRVITVFFRAIPEFIMAMVLVIAIGFGAMPGVLALGFHTMGFLAKFYAEDIEHVNSGPIDALNSIGASRAQCISFAIIPQIMPSRFGKCAKSPSDTSIASETASPSSFFIVPQTCSVLPV